MSTMSFKGKSFIHLFDFTYEELNKMITIAKILKSQSVRGERIHHLKGKIAAMIFEKPSTRTRVSFEAGMYQLGGTALYLSKNDLQLGRGETIADTARVLSKYVDILIIRTFEHSRIIQLKENSDIPVINALTDFNHPCQAMADFMTIDELFGRTKDINIAYIGDASNVCNSLIFASSIFKANMYLACPEEYSPNKDVLKQAKMINKDFNIIITENPEEAVREADIIYTDVWVSMGEEDKAKHKLEVLKKYQVNEELLKLCNKNTYYFMHCLPAHRSQEVTDGVIDGVHSVVWEQAANRMHFQKGLLYLLLSDGTSI